MINIRNKKNTYNNRSSRIGISKNQCSPFHIFAVDGNKFVFDTLMCRFYKIDDIIHGFLYFLQAGNNFADSFKRLKHSGKYSLKDIKFSARKRLVFFIYFVCLSLSADYTQNDLIKLMLSSWKHTTETDFCVSNIYKYERFAEKDFFYRKADFVYYGKKGALRLEINRGSGRKSVQIFSAPPQANWIYWHEDQAYFSQTKPVNNKVIVYPVAFCQWNSLVFGMLLQKRAITGSYHLEEVTIKKRKYLRLTVQYPYLDSFRNDIPLSHFYDNQDFDELSDIISSRYHNAQFPKLNIDDWFLRDAEFSKIPAKFKQFYIRTIELILNPGPGNHYICGYSIYDNRGKKLAGMLWRTIEHPEKQFPESMFSHPVDGKLIFTSDAASFGDNILSSYGHSPSAVSKALFSLNRFFASLKKFFSLTGKFLAAVLDPVGLFLLEYGGLVFSFVAVIIVGVIIFLKKTHRC